MCVCDSVVCLSQWACVRSRGVCDTLTWCCVVRLGGREVEAGGAGKNPGGEQPQDHRGSGQTGEYVGTSLINTCTTSFPSGTLGSQSCHARKLNRAWYQVVMGLLSCYNRIVSQLITNVYSTSRV